MRISEMICFNTSHTDGTEESHHVSLRALMAAKQTPMPASSMAKKIIERKLGLNTRKTLEARTNLLDTACHNLAKAKQRTLVSLSPSNYYLKSDITLFPLPLPPGYKPSTHYRNTPKSSSLSKSSSNSIKSKRIDVDTSNPTSNFPANNAIHVHSTSSSVSSNSPTSPFHSHSSSTTTCNSSSEALTPSSPTCTTSSSVFSAAPSSLSQSSSFSSSSANSSDLHCSALVHAFENESTFFTPLPPPPCPLKIHAMSLKEFSAMEIARACDNFDDTYKLRDGSMGPLYRAFLPEEQSVVAIARVATELSRKKWRTQMQTLGRLAHPNLCKVIGFSYERGACKMRGGGGDQVMNTGFIVYESIAGNETLEEFVEDVEKGHSHIDWSTRLTIAIGVAEGLSFLLQSHVSYGDLTMGNIIVDLSANAKLFDFVLSSSIDQKKDKKSSNVVHALGNVLLKLFAFISYPQDADTRGLKESYQMEKVYPSRDAKLVIQLAASCLLAEDSLRPSIQHVACVLRSIEPTQHVVKFSMKRSKSLTYRKKKSLSFG